MNVHIRDSGEVPEPPMFARGTPVQVRAAAAVDPSTPASVVAHLAGDASATVRRAVAARADLAPEVLDRLAKDPDRRVRAAVGGNPECPPRVLVALVNDPHWSVRWSVPERCTADSSVRRAICRSTDEDLRGLLAEVPNLDHETSAALLADPSPAVRARLAAATTDTRILATLVTDADSEVRGGAAAKPRTTPDQRRILARDRAAQVRSALVQNVTIPDDALDELAWDRSVNVRWWLATMPTTPTRIRRILMQDRNGEVALQAGASQPPRAD